MLEIKLNLENKSDVVLLFQILEYKYNECKKDNRIQMDLIEMLEGNNNNKRAVSRLHYAKSRVEKNNQQMEIIEDIMEQLKPIVDEHFDTVFAELKNNKDLVVVVET